MFSTKLIAKLKLNSIQFNLVNDIAQYAKQTSKQLNDDSFQFTPDQITYLLPHHRHRQSSGAGLACKLLLLQTPTPTSQDRLTASGDDRRECSSIT